MRCQDCATENATEARFCAECGARLAATCPACGAPVEPDHKFCQGCGHGLSKSPAREETAGERRQVTVLFADLAGFTRLTAERDAEDIHALLNRYFEAVDGAVRDYGGHVDKHIGDAVMAVFGAPTAHSDDPERAVRAALDIHAAVARLDPPLAVHVGVASGQVVASGTGSDAHREYTVTGESVNLASRLQDMAKTGETLISQAVHDSVARRFGCAPLEKVAVKGLTDPVDVWRVAALREEGERADLAFVGRQAELRQLASAIETCLESGRGQTFHLRGEAGIGKTRLASEFESLCRTHGFACHTGLVLDFGVGKGQDALRALTRSLLGIPPGGGKKVRVAAAARAVEAGWLAETNAAPLNDLLDLPQPPELRALYDAMDSEGRDRGVNEIIGALVAHAAASQPVMIKVEDLHWAESGLLAHLAALARVVAEHPTLLVLTSRIEGNPLDRAWRAALGGAPLVTIDLVPLRREEALALAGQYFDSVERLALACVERAEGNPLFLDQLLRRARDTDADDVPASVQSLVLARMDSLEGTDRRALQAASILGQRFRLDLLRYLLDRPDYECAGLIEHYLVRPEGADYLFSHALIREGVYGSLLRERRQDLHRRAAAWYAGRDPLLRAEHFDRAEDSEAAAAYLDAARLQAADYRYESALRLTDRGLEIAGDGEAGFDLALIRGEILRHQGAIEDSVVAYRAALDAAGDDVAACRARIGLAAGLRIGERFDDALDTLARAETVAAREGLDAELTEINYLRGNLYFILGNADGCLEAHGLARDHARSAGSAHGEARALGGLGDAYYLVGRMHTAHEHFGRCVEIARANGLGHVEVANLHMVGWSGLFLNEFAAARENGIAATDLAVKVGHLRAEMLGRLLESVIGIEFGETAAAADQAGRALALAQQLGARNFEAQARCHLGRCALFDGKAADARAEIARAEAIIRDIGTSFLGPYVLGMVALSATTEPARAAALVEGETMLRAGCVAHNHLWFYRDAIDLGLASGNWDEAERYADALAAFTAAEPLPWSVFHAERARLLARHGRGERGADIAAGIDALIKTARAAKLLSALPALDTARAGI